MGRPKVLVLRAAGVNCNEETAHAFEMAGADTEQVHINRLLERPALLDGFGAAAVPGGFSYGDDISAGKVLAVEIGHALGDAFRGLLARGGLLLGICNGFQVLIKTGLLPGAGTNGTPRRATLVENSSHRYEDRWVTLEVNPKRSLFCEDDAPLEVPVAHAEGRFVPGSDEELAALEQDDCVVFRYAVPEAGSAYPANPNGSVGHVAGLCDVSGQVLGLMPHPERFLFPWQHPQWTRRPAREAGDGLRIFENAVKNLRA